MTWFSHSLSKEEAIKRIFDYLLSSSPVAILFLCTSVKYFSLNLFINWLGNHNIKKCNRGNLTK